MSTILYYVHDPMCSWCWAFRPTWDRVCRAAPAAIKLVRVLGGLAPDTSNAMPGEQRQRLQEIWRNIERRVPGTQFNYDFWTLCQPRRATYPACRAVIAAVRQGENYHESMTRAIQHAYYLDARNPSDDETLVALAAELGLDASLFSRDLNSDEVRQELARQLEFAAALGVTGFPSLIVRTEKIARRLPVEFNDPELQLRLIRDAAGINV